MHKSLKYCLLLGVVGAGSLSAAASVAQDNKEYLVKAAFIYNFVKFIEWPGEKAVSKQSDIDICVLGNSAMDSTASIFNQASSAKLSLKLVQENSARSALSHCHVLFVSESEEAHLNEILATTRGHPILTVSDMSNFIDNGGMIGFVPADNKVKFEINLKAIDATGMRIDAQLLEIALKVIGK